MIVGIRGTVRRVGLDHAIIGAGPVDLRLAMPLSALTALPPASSLVELATFLYVREDVLALYGFLSEDDLALFQFLLTVQGVGPRLALNLLSVLPAAELRHLLAAGDEAALARVPGIGKRTAARLVLDLKERLGGQGSPPGAIGAPPSAATAVPMADDDLVAALVGWGFRSADAVRALALPEVAAISDPGVAVLQPLTCLFFTLLLDELTSAPGRVPTTFLLDEFANLGRLPAFASTISLARGRGLSLVLGLQALGQLEAVYGRDAATILTCCSTKVFLHGADYQTADYVSNSLGAATVGERTRSQNRTGQSTSYHQTGRPLLTPDEVRQIGTDQLIVLADNKPPLLITKQSWQAKPKPAEAGRCGEAQGWQPVV